MNRKELDLIAKALNSTKPLRGMHGDAHTNWHNTVNSVREALVEKGHLVSQDNIHRFEGIAQNGIVRGSV